MKQFSFLSKDPFHVVLRYLEELELGELYNLYQSESGNEYGYTVHYTRITSMLLHEMEYGFGEKRIVYGENEWGYPLYWKIWW